MAAAKSHYATDWLHKRAQLTPMRIGLEDAGTGQQLTFQEWNARANQSAHFLAALGVGKDDLVAVYACNCIEYLDLFFACGKLGAILHNLNWRLTALELQKIISAAAPKVLCYSSEWLAQVRELGSVLTTIKTIVAMQEAVDNAHLLLAERARQSCEQPPAAELTMDDTWGIYYTGGTTGLPKGAILTHGNMTWNSINTVTSWGLTAGDVAALQLPLFHIGGPNIFMLPLVHVGGKTILCKEFDVDETFDLIADGGLSMFVGVPTMYIMMQQHPRWHATDFSGLKLVISGGAPCPHPVMEKFWDKGVDFKLGYGLTEASGNNFWLPPEDVQRKPGSVGYPLFHIQTKIIRDDGSECGGEEAGELLIAGPHITPGYMNMPQETEAAIRDGWLHTGDLAQRDAEGYYYIVGRSKDMFISGGENVYPAEVESVMHSHPAVSEAALIGMPDEKWGEVGRAFVVPEQNESLTEAELRDYLLARIAKYKVPNSVIFLTVLPKTAIGKIDKKVLLKEYLTNQS